jgi:hypothetical protein
MYACYYLIFMFKIYLLSSKLWRPAAVVCCVLMAGSTTGVPTMENTSSSRNVAALLHNNNLRNDQSLHRGLQVLHN